MTDLWKKIRAILGQVMFATVASQCGGDDGQIFVPGDSDSTVSISITDAPIDFATAVSIEITSVELTPDDGDEFTFDLSSPLAVNLLALSDGATTAVVSNQTIDSGAYTQIRFTFTASSTNAFVDESDGNRYSLVIPGNGDDGLTITKSFTVEQDKQLDLVADVDLRRSIAPRVGSTYTFRPVIRVVDRNQAGTLTGSIPADLADDADCTPFVYVYSGSSVTPDDMDSATGGDPVVSVPVKYNVSANTYTYRASFLEAGSYTVAYTCDGAADNPDTDEALVFLAAATTPTIQANTTTTLNF
jgi:hypothetical protein